MTESTFQDVDDIFRSLPVQQIRSLEVQYRSDAAAKRTELHQLVGESYRDLLKTADTIVDMRDKTVRLRRELQQLVRSCDKQYISKCIQNARAMPHQDRWRATMLKYMASLRGLIIHYCAKGDLMTASRLYAIGLQFSGRLGQTSIHKRLLHIQQILLTHIEASSDTFQFSCACSLVRDISLLDCLTHFLSLQCRVFRSCSNLIEFAHAMLHTSSAVEDFIKVDPQMLRAEHNISRMHHVLEVDTLTVLRYIKSPEAVVTNSLSADEVHGAFQQWINTNTEAIQDIAQQLSRKENTIAVIIDQDKQIRVIFDEASQLGLYDLVKPAIDEHLQTALDLSTSSFQGFDFDSIINASVTEDSFSCKIPWKRSTLSQFTLHTRRHLYTRTMPFINFERQYHDFVRILRENLHVLEQQAQSLQLNNYKQSIMQVYDTCLKQLLANSRDANETQIIQLLRLVQYLYLTSPVQLDDPSLDPNYMGLFEKLIPRYVYTPTMMDLSTTFDDESPITISPTCHLWLIRYAQGASTIGIDLIGPQEKTMIRKAMLVEIRASQKPLANGINGHSEGSLLPHHRPVEDGPPDDEVALQRKFDLQCMYALLEDSESSGEEKTIPHVEAYVKKLRTLIGTII